MDFGNIFGIILLIHFSLSLIYALIIYAVRYQDWANFVINMLIGSFLLIKSIWETLTDKREESNY